MADVPTVPTCVALIPARAGSRRVPGKNLKPLAGQPLLRYTIAQAQAADCFSAIVVSSEDEATLELAERAGVTALYRPPKLAADKSPDIEWVQHALTDRPLDAFAILRPTAPFRRAETIRAAWRAFQDDAGIDSLRAVREVREHPAKMWRMVKGTRLLPLLPFGHEGSAPWHSSPTQVLPRVYVQTATLEMAWRETVCGPNGGTIAGETIRPFVVSGPDAFDINTPEEWAEAERIARDGPWALPAIP